MKITSKILSIPPYISTQWEYVASLRVIDEKLSISMKDGTTCSIPNLSETIIDQVFACHTEFLEATALQKIELENIFAGVRTGLRDLFSTIGKLGANAMGSIGKALEHDPKSAGLPDVSPEIAEKIRLLLSVIPEEDLLNMPEAQPNCNCMYCQINRILRQALAEKKGETPELSHEPEEPIEEKELQFSEWIVEPIADKLFKVTNKLDPKEEYRVFLGNPIGCTCGKDHCDHIIAVLRS